VEPGIGRARLDLAAAERFVSLRRQLGVTSFGMNQLVLEPRQRSRIHRHAHQEEVCAGEHVGRDGEAFTSWEEERGAPPQEVAMPEDLPPPERAS
jgi:hypothetical protein